VPLRIADGTGLERRRLESAKAEVDDLGSLLDGVDDPGRLVDVRDRAVGMRDLHAEELGVATEAGDPFAVGDRAGRQRGDERAVAVVVTDVAPVLEVDDAIDLRVLRRYVRLPEVDACVDDGDLDTGGRAENGVRHVVEAGRGVLPFVRDAGPVHVSNGGFRRLR